MCELCEQQKEGEKKGKISTRKELTLLCRLIGEFMNDFYLVSLEKLVSHKSFVKILSKQECRIRPSCMNKR